MADSPSIKRRLAVHLFLALGVLLLVSTVLLHYQLSSWVEHGFGPQELDARIAVLDRTMVIFAIVVLGTALLSVHYTLRRDLSPLGELARVVETLDEESLATEIRLPTTPAELAPVVLQLNALLKRLEGAVQRERVLSSNLAHELRTPLAELQSLAEVAQEWPEDTEAVRMYFADVQSIGKQLQSIVVQLLLLARSESGQATVTKDWISLHEAVRDAWRWCGGGGGLAGNVADVSSSASRLAVRTDSEKLALVLRNVLANAREHRTEGSAIECRGEVGSSEAISLTVSNRVDSLEASDLAVMFDRFWRKDPSRTSGLRTGLGLALVRSVVALLGLEVHTSLGSDSIFHLQLIFPSEDSSATGPVTSRTAHAHSQP